MKIDIVLAGVGGQGVLTIAAIIANAAMNAGLETRQGESHGMSQRGGAVQAHLRLADHTIHGDLIAAGAADLLVAMEPLEALRWASLLARDGTVIAAEEPVRNIPDYPPLDEVHRRIQSLPRAVLVPTAELARRAGALRATNMVLVGAVSAWLPIDADGFEQVIRTSFARKGAEVVATCVGAFQLGREFAPCPAR